VSAALTDAPSPDLALVQACEERIVNAWPAVDALLIDGWIVRFAHGYSGRANSATPIRPGAAATEATLAAVEGLYAQAGLPACFRITPLADPAAEAVLLGRGYRVRDASVGMIAPLAGLAGPASDQVRIEAAASRAWLAGVSAFQDASKRSSDHLQAIVGRIRIPAAFATLRLDGEAAGFAMGAVDRGMAEIGSVIVDPKWRGRGLGRTIVAALMLWARDAGAAHAFLQVAQDNAPARSLYASLGFRDAYLYRTLSRAL